MIGNVLKESNSLKIILIWIFLMALLIVCADVVFLMITAVVPDNPYAPVAVTSLTSIMSMIIGMIVKDIMVILQEETKERLKLDKENRKKKKAKRKGTWRK